MRRPFLFFWHVLVDGTVATNARREQPNAIEQTRPQVILFAKW